MRLESVMRAHVRGFFPVLEFGFVVSRRFDAVDVTARFRRGLRAE